MSLDLWLNPPRIALIASGSLNGNPIEPQSDKLKYGTVYKINFMTLNFAVGDNVLFNSEKAEIVNQLTQSYFIVSENDCEFIEDAPL